MSTTQKPQSAPDDAICQQAARWIVGRDRGLSATESIEFELWLAADERHVAALARYASAWETLGRIPDQIGKPLVKAAARTHNWLRISMRGLAAAASLAVAYAVWQWTAHPVSGPTATVAEKLEGPQIVTLADGTIVRVNADSKVVAHYTPTERRVTLVRGEAFFLVTKNPAVPFIVSAGTVKVRAVGTAFDVNLESAAVEVLVTDGRVRVENNLVRADGSAQMAIPLLKAGDRAVVALAPVTMDTAIVVTNLNREEMAKALEWQRPLSRLAGATLFELAAEFQRRTGQRLLLPDPSLAQLRIGGRFRTDDIEGFVRLMEANYGMRSERTPDGAIILRKAP